VPVTPVVTPPITMERRAVVTDTVQLPKVILAWLSAPAFTRETRMPILHREYSGRGKVEPPVSGAGLQAADRAIRQIALTSRSGAGVDF
jgi:hypothetical protein